MCPLFYEALIICPPHRLCKEAVPGSIIRQLPVCFLYYITRRTTKGRQTRLRFVSLLQNYLVLHEAVRIFWRWLGWISRMRRECTSCNRLCTDFPPVKTKAPYVCNACPKSKSKDLRQEDARSINLHYNIKGTRSCCRFSQNTVW